MTEQYNIEELIICYLQQKISENELRALESWLEQSADNKSYFFQLKNIHDASRYSSFSSEEIKEKSWLRMEKRIGKEEKQLFVPTKIPANKTMLSLLKYVAVILFVFGIGWGIGNIRLNSTDISKVTYNEIYVQKGGRANTILLSDGSKVVLNAATTFRYPASFDDKTRTVYLDGEAYFDVAKDAKKPFIVKTQRQDITVLGTTFNVEAYSDISFSAVTLLSGSISLNSFNDKGENIGYMQLKPNQKALFDIKNESVSVENLNASQMTSWINGEFKFKDAPLIVIMRHLEHYYDVRIHIEKEDIENIKYTGTFSLDQSIEDVLKIIDYKEIFTFKKEGRDIFITDN